jgi:hypothetical protein
MAIPAIAAGAATGIGALAGRLAGIQIPKWMWYVLGGQMLFPSGMQTLQMSNERKRVLGEVELGKRRLSSETETAKRINEENRRASDQYMAMLADQNRKETAERSKDRQMQLLMAMLAGQRNFQQGTVQAMQGMAPNRSFSMAALLR